MTGFLPGGFSAIKKENWVKNEQNCFDTTWERECDANM